MQRVNYFIRNTVRIRTDIYIGRVVEKHQKIKKVGNIERKTKR